MEDYRKIAEALRVLDEAGIGNHTLNENFQILFSKIAQAKSDVDRAMKDIEDIESTLTERQNEIELTKHKS